jgi:hypothetical protein
VANGVDHPRLLTGDAVMLGQIFSLDDRHRRGIVRHGVDG